jgi:hypothetical protein
MCLREPGARQTANREVTSNNYTNCHSDLLQKLLSFSLTENLVYPIKTEAKVRN